MEAGLLRTSENRGAGLTDVTADNLERIKKHTADLDRLLLDLENADISP